MQGLLGQKNTRRKKCLFKDTALRVVTAQLFSPALKTPKSFIPSTAATDYLSISFSIMPISMRELAKVKPALAVIGTIPKPMVAPPTNLPMTA